LRFLISAPPIEKGKPFTGEKSKKHTLFLRRFLKDDRIYHKLGVPE